MRRLLIPLLVIALITSCTENSAGPDSDNGENGEGSELATYTINISKSPSDAGSIEPSTSETYEEGETVELMGLSDEEFRFTEWTGDMESSENPLLLTVDQNYELTANFEKKSYELTVNTEGEGAVNEEIVQEKSTDYEHGTVVELTANPSEEYKFVEWIGDLSGSENPARITVDEAKEVTAIFESRIGSVEVTASTSGENQDSDGYAFSIADKENSIGVNETITIEGLEEGSYNGELTGLAENCSVDSDNPKSLEVSGGETISVVFEVYCEANTKGYLEVTTSTSGQEQDEDGYTILIAEQEESIGSNETNTIRDIDEGSYDVELSGIAGNCSVNGDNPRSVDIIAGETAFTAYEVNCETASEGERIAFVSDRDGNNEIYTMKPDGSNLKRLTNNSANESVPVWSPNGSKIAFISDRDGNEEIYTMNSDGSNLQRLTNSPTEDVPRGWSPDGSRISFQTNRDGNYEIYTMSSGGGDMERVTNNSSDEFAPSWSPDGTRIAFNSEKENEEGNSGIYTVKPDGSDLQLLTDYNHEDTAPVWSPDGSQIVFFSNRDRNEEIYIINSDGTDLQRVTNNPANDVNPFWSPDGSRITFQTNRDGNDEIYTVKPEGGDLHLITVNDASDHLPSWGSIE